MVTRPHSIAALWSVPQIILFDDRGACFAPTVQRVRVDPATFWSQVQCSNHYAVIRSSRKLFRSGLFSNSGVYSSLFTRIVA